MDKKTKVKILCVDDEQNVLEGLALHLERRFDMQTALGGALGLELLAREPDIAVIISDMRMPGMDGATFLARTRQVAPSAVRLLLTGQTDLDSAIAAVNDGQIFRFLTKPCASRALLVAVEAAIEQHMLITAERELLEKTLHGCIKALTDVLALTNPVAFGRATRIKRLAGELAAKLALSNVWQVEVAAMLSQLAHITLSPKTAESVYFGRPLSGEEQRQVDHLPAVTQQLLANIPRIDAVRTILDASARAHEASADGSVSEVARGRQILQVALDFDALESQGNNAALALDTMLGRGERYALEVIQALRALRGNLSTGETIKEVPAAQLLVGMLLAEDVFLPTGVLLVARGHEITPRFMERIRNLPPGALKKQLRVTVRTVVGNG